MFPVGDFSRNSIKWRVEQQTPVVMTEVFAILSLCYSFYDHPQTNSATENITLVPALTRSPTYLVLILNSPKNWLGCCSLESCLRFAIERASHRLCDKIWRRLTPSHTVHTWAQVESRFGLSHLTRPELAGGLHTRAGGGSELARTNWDSVLVYTGTTYEVWCQQKI